MDIDIRILPGITVAYMRHTGPYGSPGIGALWSRFANWGNARGLLVPGRMVIGISQDSPAVTPADQLRYDACVQVDPGFRPDGEAGVQSLPGGRHACARFEGDASQIHEAWSTLFGRWLPGSGWQPGDRHCFEWYDVGTAVDAAGRFSCLLCVPVKPL